MRKRRRIVAVVDDDPSMLRAAENLLDAHGFATKSYSSAEEFLGIVSKYQIDCVLLDIHLRGLSGIELRQQLRSSHPTLPVIFMTALDDDRVRQQALETGCAACLSKPFPAQQLLDAIEKACGT